MKRSDQVFIVIICSILLGGITYAYRFIVEAREQNEDVNIVLSLEEAAHLSDQEIADRMLRYWLMYFQQRTYSSALRDFSVERIDDVVRVNENIQFIASFSVQPKKNPQNSEWYVNLSGGHIKGAWIRNITLRFLLIRTDDGYVLRALE